MGSPAVEAVPGIPATMWAVVKHAAGPGAELREVPVPEPGPGEVLVEVLATSICGTDYHIYRWDRWAAGRVRPPLIMGHEFAGRIVALGEGVGDHAVGEHVSVETHVTCQQCVQCSTGRAHVCRRTAIIGVDRDGSFARYVAVPAVNVWGVDEDLTPEIASIHEPLGNAVHTALAQDLVGRSVLVVGAGPIGLMAIPVARKAGARTVYAVDVVPYRLELARRLGATVAINAAESDPVTELERLTGGEGVDVMLEMSGNARAIEQGLTALAPGGEAALLGLPPAPITVEWSNQIVLKGITLRGIAGRRLWATWHQTRNLLKAGLDLGPLITHRLPLHRFAEGMELMGSGRCGKVVLLPGEE